MMGHQEANDHIQLQHEKPHDFIYKESKMLREKLATVFDLVSMQKGHKVVSDGDLVGDGNIFYYEAHFNPGADAGTTVLTQQDFSV